MIRAVLPYTLAMVLSIASFALAHARGTSPDMGDALDMVICTGVGMVTMKVGPDGEPIESIHLCPDGAQSVVATFTLPVVQPPEARLILQIADQHAVAHLGQSVLTPSARGPPVVI